MLDKFKKLLKAESEEMKKGTEEAADVALQVGSESLEAIKTEFESFKAAANGLLKQAEAERDELKTKLQAATEALAKVAEEKAQMVASAKAKASAERKAKIEAAIGKNEKADALFSATEQMEDAAFEAIVTALQTSVEVEANSEMFTEQGASASVDVTKVADNGDMKRLEAAIAAEMGITAR
jgi:hypothetical protein